MNVKSADAEVFSQLQKREYSVRTYLRMRYVENKVPARNEHGPIQTGQDQRFIRAAVFLPPLCDTFNSFGDILHSRFWLPAAGRLSKMTRLTRPAGNEFMDFHLVIYGSKNCRNIFRRDAIRNERNFPCTRCILFPRKRPRTVSIRVLVICK